ncbi:hypothetical protein TPHA_0P01700 [Tetrapisispora phaffii CBS 4417]|uniref:Altered inheritance of mitochondria protein 6 n=1 Tax=Tetrapisispora phaffii (strain ATCC 24235 / CBS 4417 / NBRC 1672 / NRRL Y-8282 / UCD 70-5) TaxID=1071381 RepID=G8C2F0_TETPH|nr:hypothetical protein TPHA_0P01700 [Tetrapisispora phaffii CBS 4417]CCE66328.1 hypothetical protein TPHA_0P01700 [Tetrapisispora phaffii CBS 4417]
MRHCSRELLKVFTNVTLLLCIIIFTVVKFWDIDTKHFEIDDKLALNDALHQYRYLIDNQIQNIELVNYYKNIEHSNKKLMNYLAYASSETNNTMISFLNKNVKPNTFHSHNDYTRQMPLFEALSLGLTSIEADVWLGTDNQRLSVAHRETDLLNYPLRDLNDLYTEPLLTMLNDVNEIYEHFDYNSNTTTIAKKGLYHESENRTMFLVIDFKSEDSSQTYTRLMDTYLKPFIENDFITFFNITSNEMSWRPITVILTGNKPTDLSIIDKDSETDKIGYLGDSKRYVFPEQMLDNLTNLDESSKTFVASTSFSKLCMACDISPWKVILRGKLPARGLRCFKKFIDDAHANNLKTRIWGVPKSLLGFSKNFWRQQIDDLGVDFINVDHLSRVLSYPNYDHN